MEEIKDKEKMYLLKTRDGYISEYWSESEENIITTELVTDAVKFNNIDDVYFFINTNYKRLAPDIVLGILIEEYEKENKYKWIHTKNIII